jgi:VWFA-related protein
MISLLPAALILLPAQQPPPATPATLHVAARQVVLDVVVTDSYRHPVKGLSKSDFTLYEDGVPQTLVSFTEHDATEQPPAPPPAPLPPNTFANHAPVTNTTAMTVLLFDTSQLPFTDAAYTRYEVASYIKKIAPGTPICIFDLDQWGLRLIQDFTTDPNTLRQAVESKNNAQKPRNPYFTPVLRRTVAMRDLAGYLASYPGRKNLIWFTGYSPSLRIGGRRGLFPDTTTFNQQTFAKDLQEVTGTLTLSRVALYTVDPRGVVYDEPEPFGLHNPLGARASVAFRANVEDDVLFQGADNAAAAAKTGGKAFYNSNAIDKDVAEVVATGSHYYTVAYAPTNTNWDGSFRAIKVQIANSGLAHLASQQPPAQLKGPLHLLYRSGYSATPEAPRPSAAGGSRPLISYSPRGAPASAQQTPLDAAMNYGGIPPFQVLFKAHIDPDPTREKLQDKKLPPGNYLAPEWRGHPYRSYQIHFTIDPHSVQFTQHTVESFHDTVEFVGVVYNDHGDIVNSFINKVAINVPAAQYAAMIQAGLGAQIPIAIPAKGDFYLRLGVHDLNSNHVGALEIPVDQIALPAKAAPSH